MVGKRKREAAGASEGTLSGRRRSPEVLAEDGGDIFRKHFEAQFKPLERRRRRQKVAAEEDSSLLDADDASEWSGISDQEETQVEVIDHTRPTNRDDNPQLMEEKRGFMTSKPPTQGSKRLNPRRNTDDPDTEDATDAGNLKKDLALQRLLQESHLLESNGSLDPSGTNRHKALDLRLQSLGSKSSIYKQEKMPMSHRKGIVAKATEREVQRRKEAKENGIVLEKAKNVKKPSERRERGIGGPTVGKYRNGILKLSEKDVTDIQGSGSRKGSSRGGKGRKR